MYVLLLGMSVHSESDSEGAGEVDGRRREVWQTVHVSVEREQNRSMTMIRDPVSNWVVAELLPEAEDESRAVASFMFRTFCCFGFPKIELHNFDTVHFEEITSRYLEMVERAVVLVPQMRGVHTDLLLKSGEARVPDGLACSSNKEELAARLFRLRLGDQAPSFGRRVSWQGREKETRKKKFSSKWQIWGEGDIL